MAQYGMPCGVSPAPCNCQPGEGQPRINSRNAFINSNQLHINYRPEGDRDVKQDVVGLQGARVFGPAPPIACED